MLLADAAQVAEGKLYIMGGGWEVCGPEPTPMALAVKVEIPPSQARRKHTWSVMLVDDTGEPVLLPLRLEPGSSYAWRLTIDNQTRRDWRVSFSTRPATVPPPA
jgi:hypothetical protein